MRFRVVFAFIFVVVGTLALAAEAKLLAPNSSGESGDAEGTYFRFQSKYLVNGSEALEFDLVVSCGTHRFESGRKVRGYLPALYAKETSTGSALMMATPRVCDAIRDAEDRPVSDAGDFTDAWQFVLDGNFVPFVIWFEDANDLTRGFGYADTAAYTNPHSRLEFLGASIEPSTKQSFEKWFAGDNENLIDQIQLGPRFVTDEDHQSYWATFDPSRKLMALGCFGVAITPHDAYVSSKNIADFYPGSETTYWLAPATLQDTRHDGGPSKTDLTPHVRGYYVGTYSREFPLGFNYLRRQKIEKKGPHGQSLWSVPTPVYYPLKRSDGHPFANQGSLEDGRLVFTVDLREEKRGTLDCYSRFDPIGYGTKNFQDLYEYYFGREYGEKLVRFGETIDLELIDDSSTTVFENIPLPVGLPHFLIADRAAAEFITFEYFGGGHVE